MSKTRFRSAVTPIRRPYSASSQATGTVAALVEQLRPAEPLHCVRPAQLRATAARFVERFAGDVLYAVKCNPEPAFLRALHAGGIRHFDAASPAEIRLVRQLFDDAEIHYMHPVKGRAAIRNAYHQYGVRDFSLDSVEELDKILDETGGADDLGLFIRLALPKGSAVYDLSGKFGAEPAVAVELLRRARGTARRVGLCFHVGSQCLDPAAYELAIARAGAVIAEAGVALDVLDLGGGFPVAYPGITPPPLDDFMAAIERGVGRLGLPATCRLWCEPGRALVAAGGSLVVQVEARRGSWLHVNDGIYGNLSDAGALAFRFPVRAIRPGEGFCGAESEFGLFGPTCDSADRMAGPFVLPADIREGDWIEIGQLGAYGSCLRTGFNGFDRMLITEVADPPLLETAGHPTVGSATPRMRVRGQSRRRAA